MLARVRSIDFFLSDCRTRVPFGFGQVTLRGAPLLLARAVVECDGAAATGLAADLLVPKWFDKDPKKSARRNAEDLIASAGRAAESLVTAGEGGEALPVFELWRRAHGECVRGAPNGLLAGFGVALCERALIDAACRAAGVGFFQALERDLFAVEPARVYPALEGWDLAASLPDAPLASVALRHTVGLADALRASELQPAARVRDGAPEALDEEIRARGVTHFKLKLRGERARDVARLVEIARVLTECSPAAEPVVTVDGNEQFASLADLAATLDEVAAAPEGARLLRALAVVEQPLPRAITFDPRATADMAAIERFAPVIVDEADDGVMAFPRAIERGYRGISLKNCKGVFKGLLHRGLCQIAAERHGLELFQSAEDLTNLPVVALQQDLAAVCAHGLPHVERNGHHYFRGLDHLPREEARAALAAHPDLYRERADGGVELRIEGGRLACSSLAGPGFGYSIDVAPERRTPLASWVHPEGPGDPRG